MSFTRKILQALLAGIFFMIIWLPASTMLLNFLQNPEFYKNKTSSPKPPIRWDKTENKWLPTRDMVFDFAPKSGPREKRHFESMPPIPFNYEDIKNFPKRFASFYDDHFGFRQQAIQLHSWFKLKTLRASPNPNVVLGDQGWLFYNENDVIDDYRGMMVFSPLEMDQWRISLEKKRDWLKGQGIVYLFVIAPEKSTIYPEFIPKRFNKVGPSRMGQLVDYLKKNSDMDILDLREPLLTAKKNSRVYLRTDTHWNNLGAFVAYKSILDKLNRLDPGLDLSPFPLPTFKVSYRENFSGDLADLMGIQNFIHEEYVDIHPISRPCGRWIKFGNQLNRDGVIPLATKCLEGKGKLVMFRDSFANGFIPFISEHFQRSVYILNEIRDMNYLKKTVEIENPDIVIEEVVERWLSKVPSL